MFSQRAFPVVNPQAGGTARAEVLGSSRVSCCAADAPVLVLQVCAADGVPAPAARQRHVAVGADGREQRRHDLPLSLCHFQLPAGKWDGVSSVADPGEHTAAPGPPKTC